MMDLYQGRSVRAFRLFVWLLAFGSKTSSLQTDPTGELGVAGEAIYATHPTIQRASLLNGFDRLLETNKLAVVRSRNTQVRKLIKYPGSYNESLGREYSSKTSFYQVRQNSSYYLAFAQAPISYSSEITNYKRNKADLSDPHFGRHSTCHKHAYRSFDVAKATGTKGEPALAVAIEDTHICLMYHESFNDDEMLDKLPGEPSRVSELKLPLAELNRINSRFRVAAVILTDPPRLAPGLEEAPLEIYDEAGQVYKLSISRDKQKGEMSWKVSKFAQFVTSVTAVNLIKDQGNTDFEDERARNLINATKGGISAMEQHFDHAFVEAITMLDGKLAYGRGLFHEPNLRFVNRRNSAWPRAIEGLPSTLDKTIVAYETFRRNGSRYHHVFDLQLRRADGHQYMDDQSYYWFCVVPVGEAELQITWPAGSKHCSYTPHEVKRTPIDVVYREQCDKVYAFYQHLVQWESGDKKLTKDSPYAVLEWMRFPLNAILHHKDRLYLFGPANSLRISEPIGSDCTFERLIVPKQEYYQSDLLLMLSQAAGELPHPGEPIYDGDRYLERRTSGETWWPPLTTRKEIPEHLRLAYETDTSKITSTPSPNLSSPKPTVEDSTMKPSSVAPPRDESETSTTMLIIVLVAIIVLGIVGAFLYFVYFTKSAPARLKPKTRSKKSKRSPGVTGAAPSSKQSATPSTISDRPTIRSDQHESAAPTSKTGPDSTVKSQVAAPSESPDSSKRKRSPVSASRSPNKVSKSVASGASRSTGSKVSKSPRTLKTPKSPTTPESVRNVKKS